MRFWYSAVPATSVLSKTTCAYASMVRLPACSEDNSIAGMHDWLKNCSHRSRKLNQMHLILREIPRFRYEISRQIYGFTIYHSITHVPFFIRTENRRIFFHFIHYFATYTRRKCCNAKKKNVRNTSLYGKIRF